MGDDETEGTEGQTEVPDLGPFLDPMGWAEDEARRKGIGADFYRRKERDLEEQATRQQDLARQMTETAREKFHQAEAAEGRAEAASQKAASLGAKARSTLERARDLNRQADEIGTTDPRRADDLREQATIEERHGRWQEQQALAEQRIAQQAQAEATRLSTEHETELGQANQLFTQGRESQELSEKFETAAEKFEAEAQAARTLLGPPPTPEEAAAKQVLDLADEVGDQAVDVGRQVLEGLDTILPGLGGGVESMLPGGSAAPEEFPGMQEAPAVNPPAEEITTGSLETDEPSSVAATDMDEPEAEPFDAPAEFAETEAAAIEVAEAEPAPEVEPEAPSAVEDLGEVEA